MMSIRPRSNGVLTSPPRETHAELVERLRKGQPPARPMVSRILTDPPHQRETSNEV